MAELCGLSKSAVCRYERGDRLPDIEAAARIADFFDVSLDDLCCKKSYVASPNGEEVEETPDIM